MAFHPGSFTIKQYIADTYPLFVPAIEEMQLAADQLPNGKEAIFDGFLMLVGYFSNIDGDISVMAIDFFIEIEELFEEEDDRATSEIWAKTFAKSSDHYKLSIPYAIYYLDTYDKKYGTIYGESTRVMFFRFANAFIKADGKITSSEQKALSDFKDLLYPNGIIPSSVQSISLPTVNSSANKTAPSHSLEELLDELNSLIGLEAVKNDVNQLVNFLKVQQIRQSKGMVTVPISRHLVFYGNPGTGKTTVARLLARIYKALNVISKGHLVETDRSGLVAGYVGQTALKVQEVVTRALGGVLFIDEAYALLGEGQDYGKEAIDTLLKLMEDNRDDLIVVVAGYTEKMSKFLLSNPGFKSRFNKYLSFQDYSPNQLASIFERFCKEAGFNYTKEAFDKINGILQLMYDMRDETFGNARLVRNLFEQSINNQASRIVTLMDISEEILSTIEAVDIPGEVEIHTL